MFKYTTDTNGIADTLVDHFVKLSPASQELRFFGVKTPTAIQDWVLHVAGSKNYQNHWLLNDDNTAVGHISIDQTMIAEIAVSVLDDAQGQGLGKRMIAELISKCRELSVKEVIVCCLPKNHAIIKLLKAEGFELMYCQGDMVGTLTM
jgi:L-amino acid N-acyltransferase YncA